ncbi:hypothetical protein GQX74_000150 [Glossina fuscipes]|nr:hypothetical protein GQX74_000150 [Glossina fuscipes]
MGSSLMVISQFRKPFERCHKALASKGLTLAKIPASSEATIFENILYCFVGIEAVQIAIVNLLRSLNMKPDYIIGVMACGYADGGFTADLLVRVVTTSLILQVAIVCLSYFSFKPDLWLSTKYTFISVQISMTIIATVFSSVTLALLRFVNVLSEATGRSFVLCKDSINTGSVLICTSTSSNKILSAGSSLGNL